MGIFSFWKHALAKRSTTANVGEVMNLSVDKSSEAVDDKSAIGVTPSIKVVVTPSPKVKEESKKTDETNNTQTPDPTTTTTLSPTSTVTVDNCAAQNLSGYDDLILADSPVAYLTFDSDYYCDRSGNGLNGEKKRRCVCNNNA